MFHSFEKSLWPPPLWPRFTPRRAKADGSDVVVKAVRPNIEKTIRKDIALMYTLARLLAKYSEDGRRLRPVEVIADYEQVIYDELNLQAEGANASLLRHNLTVHRCSMSRR